jgi:hypothetical protein
MLKLLHGENGLLQIRQQSLSFPDSQLKNCNTAQGCVQKEMTKNSLELM